MTFQFRKEAIEENLNSNFPSQGQGNPPLYYSLSDVVVPTYSINQVAEGSALPQNLQTAWDFSTGQNKVANSIVNIVTTPGFWQVDLNASLLFSNVTTRSVELQIRDGVSNKSIWKFESQLTGADDVTSVADASLIVFLRSGDTLRGVSNNSLAIMNVWYRQVATLNGTLVNPLGYSAA